LKMLQRGAVVLAAMVAALATLTGPASASGGWVDQGTFRDMFKCGDAGDRMIANGSAATWRCTLEGNRYHLYTVAGPWVYHSSYTGGMWDCAIAGQNLVDNGSVNSWQCLYENGADNLYVV